MSVSLITKFKIISNLLLFIINIFIEIWNNLIMNVLHTITFLAIINKTNCTPKYWNLVFYSARIHFLIDKFVTQFARQESWNAYFNHYEKQKTVHVRIIPQKYCKHLSLQDSSTLEECSAAELPPSTENSFNFTLFCFKFILLLYNFCFRGEER